MERPALDSANLARYIEATDSISKPWPLQHLRLLKLQEQKSELSPATYETALQEIHQDLMNLGEWWLGQGSEVF
jgi:hypothetical protein